MKAFTMEYVSPQSFCVARPHLSPMLSDDPAAAIRSLEAEAAKKGVATAEMVIGRAMGSNASETRDFAARKGFEGIAWETVGIDALRNFHAAGGIHHRVVGDSFSDADWVPASVLHGLDRAHYIEIGNPDRQYAHGVMFTPVPSARAEGDERRDHVQITIWPRDTDADWRQPGSGGYRYDIVADDGDDLNSAISSAIARAAKAAANIGLPGFRSDATTLWTDDLANVVRRHAAALAGIVARPLPEPVLQDGVKPYLLAKLAGPKGDATLRSLLRRGYVMEHRHDFGGEERDVE